MHTLAIIRTQKQEGLVDGICVSRPRKGQVGQVVCVNLRLVCACAHNPFAVVGYTNAVGCLFELEVLEELYVVGIVVAFLALLVLDPVGDVGSG